MCGPPASTTFDHIHELEHVDRLCKVHVVSGRYCTTYAAEVSASANRNEIRSMARQVATDASSQLITVYICDASVADDNLRFEQSSKF